jgi:hypothetical protein
MSVHLKPYQSGALCCAVLLSLITAALAIAQQTQSTPRFGGEYSALDARRQQLVNDWVARFAKTTGQKLDPGPFYDELLSQSAKTTFEAVTHALMTTRLTDRTGGDLGDGLGLIEHVDTVRGEIAGAASDHQFRMYARLMPDAIDKLTRSQQFRRGIDNSVYHQGFPINYRGQGGVPSVQVSLALDKRRADIDVDYRASTFPIGLFNGHLTSSNSDVRAGSNYDRHVNRWVGFQNWWRGFFGVRQEQSPEVAAPASPYALPKSPRAGTKPIDVMVNDFLNAWLIEGDIVTAMGYISERSYACLAQDLENPADFDRGLAPFQLMVNLKAAHDSLGPHTSLEGLIVGTRLVSPALRVVRQPHHPQFVIYAIPDDIAAKFDCESRLTLGDPGNIKRVYGNYFGATFYIGGGRNAPLALLWAREAGYWKIVSWRVGGNEETAPTDVPVAGPKIVRVSADPTLVQAARGFLESWLVQKDTGAAFGYISPKAYGCYDLERGPEAPASTSAQDAALKLRAALESAGKSVGTPRSLDAILSAVEPVHPSLQLMNHSFARVFSLTNVPNALADALECDARAAGSTLPDPLPLVYGSGYGMTVRFKTQSGDAPVLRLLWRRETAGWRITSYGIESP